MRLGTGIVLLALGAILTFAGQAVYAPHFHTTLAWGMTPLEDQQAAGLIMWAPAAAAYLLVALWREAGLLDGRAAARPATRCARSTSSSSRASAVAVISEASSAPLAWSARGARRRSARRCAR